MRLQIFFVTFFGFCGILSTVFVLQSDTVYCAAKFRRCESPGSNVVKTYRIFSEGLKGVRISNLNGTCFRCLCHVAGCDMNRGCSEGYCGPFIISRVYWVDAGKPTLPDDDPERKEAFEDCAKDYHCSIRIVESYMAKFGKDCNNDGMTDCFDYMMINFNGAACSKPLSLTKSGRRWLSSYQQCRFNT